MSGRQQEAEALRREADALRDKREWRAAAEAYGAFLALRPDDAGMQVQRGHCLKEAGDVPAALALYRSAAALRPRDADIPLQIGHAEKILGRRDAARDAYAEAALLAPLAENPWREWQALAAARPGRAAPAAAGVVLDLTDLAAWVRGGHRAPSGIQRVQLDLARAALARQPAPRLAAMARAGGGWRELPAPLFLRLDLLMTTGADTTDPDWLAAVALLEAIVETPPPLRFAPGAVLATLGGSWSLPDHLACLRAARERDGLRHVPLLHDCIPLLLPEHCAEGVVRDYARWFANLSLHADGVIAVSRSTAEDMKRLHRALLPELPVPEAAVLRLDAAPRAVAGAAPPHPLLRGDTPFVLFVSTIEGRKNHLMVFNAWLSMLRRAAGTPAAAQVPMLVCVGRPGWRAEPAMALLEGAPELRARVRILSEVSDPLLAALYRASLFTLYNSHHEGWGLPVTESLAAGKVALVPRHSSLVEAGEGGAVFFAPNSEPDLLAQLQRLIHDRGFREQAEAAIRPPPRGWDQLAAQFLGDAARLADAGGPRPAPPVAAGRVHPLKRLEGSRPRLAMAVAETLREGEAWHPLEPWGCWTRPGAATLALAAPDPGPLWLEISLRGLPLLEGPVPDQPVELLVLRDDLPAGEARLVTVAAGAAPLVGLQVAAGGGMLRVEILCRAAGVDAEGRAIGIGVTALGLAAADSVPERLALLEARSFAMPRDQLAEA
ncbi:glycosyltransferase [Roseomonas sp. 18066]|uniref:glycosyltransferase n=1 Tax=Roseomonas sp. 18066 TaxID=2681412 RepID=UPI00135CAFA8|nr:glycosyltransferase [Roseomonas sp. 18066]